MSSVLKSGTTKAHTHKKAKVMRHTHTQVINTDTCTAAQGLG